MPRGPKPAKSKEAKPPVARKSPKNDGARVRDLGSAWRRRYSARRRHWGTSKHATAS